FWTRPPFGFLWLLGIVSLAVAVGVYPIIRRLTQRLEALQRSVQKFGEGDLSVRVPEQGQDEVADLARQFNAAAERVETLVKSH
ncbi:HAMP domain-containing protein, partial [Pseudomonas sp. FW306-02-F08-AA]